MKRIIFLIGLFVSVFSYGQNIHNRSVRIFYALDYGLNVNDSTVDNQAAIQRAINAVQASGTGGTVHIPWGVFGLNSTLTVSQSDIYIEGEGSGTVLKGLSDYGDIITFIPTVNPPTDSYQFHDIGVRNLKIRSAVARTSGYAIGSIYTHNLTIDHVIIGDLRTSQSPFNVITPFFGGVSFKFGSNFLMQNTMINAWHEGVYISGKTIGTGVFNTSNFDGLITGNTMITGDSTKWHAADTTYGIKIDGGTGGFQLEQSNVSYYTSNVLVTANYGTNRELYLNHAFVSDNSGSHGINIRPGSLIILQMTGSWSCGSGRAGPAFSGNGINISAGNSNLATVITGGTFYANAGYGIMDSSGTVAITGAQFKANSAPNTVNDIYIGTGITSSVIGSCLTPVGITNAATNYPQMNGNINQPVFNQNTSSTGSAQYYWLNNSGNFLTNVIYGSSFAGSTAGVTNAGLGFMGGNVPVMVGPTSGSSLYFITNNVQRLSFDQNGNATFGIGKFGITEGTNGRTGQTTLVSGTKAITISGLTTSSRAFVTLVTPSGTSSTVTYQGVCTSNTLTLQANVAAGTINVADGSTLNYLVINSMNDWIAFMIVIGIIRPLFRRKSFHSQFYKQAA
jgi:hypothetical protein